MDAVCTVLVWCTWFASTPLLVPDIRFPNKWGPVPAVTQTFTFQHRNNVDTKRLWYFGEDVFPTWEVSLDQLHWRIRLDALLCLR